ncbi:hypothetical protein D4Q52_19315 [Rhodopseudomonas palustris]|uniref:Uncharacterized protein n=1 Tax=Rhodopseudomonas palustris TaxID=1076 RepID=A0A418V1U5_RHOPL|nr:hypothetical protein D4Q52_19315 [Rhodopseudomonas palustris]
MRATSAGGYVLIVSLGVLLVAAVVIAWIGWASAPGTEVPAAGYFALAIGVGFSLMVGFGLMALVFASSRLGYDEPAELITPNHVENERDCA